MASHEIRQKLKNERGRAFEVTRRVRIKSGQVSPKISSQLGISRDETQLLPFTYYNINSGRKLRFIHASRERYIESLQREE